jgi:hypothetical protein
MIEPDIRDPTTGAPLCWREVPGSGAGETSFDRGGFLVPEPLVPVDRYAKMCLPDVPDLWDTTAHERLLADPTAAAS